MPPKTQQRKDTVQRDPNLRDTVIQAGDNVLVQLASGDIRNVKVDQNSCVCHFSIDAQRLTVAQNCHHQ